MWKLELSAGENPRRRKMNLEWTVNDGAAPSRNSSYVKLHALVVDFLSILFFQLRLNSWITEVRNLGMEHVRPLNLSKKKLLTNTYKEFSYL